MQGGTHDGKEKDSFVPSFPHSRTKKGSRRATSLIPSIALINH